ncbi:MAG TPA: SdrD B-like domain-containing protein [Humisphaera sp.]|jgi:uncharacterized delta-60 repeat protein|nr:SdrD B-like domain-containing protein [Humisphaera sp.]
MYELLERRTLLSGNTIVGTVYDDLNGNGVKDAGEAGIAGVVISLNAIFGPSPSLLTTTSDGSGAYSFPNLADGPYSALIPVANRKVTSTGAAAPFISVSGGNVVNADLGTTTFSKSPLSDATFGVQGVARDSANAYPSGVTRQADGRLVVVGNHSIYRLTADGAPDPTFNGGAPQLSLDTDDYCGVAVQSNGKIDVAAGDRVMQYNADGTVDKSFGTSGVAVYHFGASTYFQGNTEIALESDGKIVLANQIESATGPSQLSLLRFTAGGVPDVSLNGTGEATLALPSLQAVERISVQADNKIVVALSQTGIVATGVVARVLPSGTFDPAFGTAGLASLGSIGVIPNDVLVQSSGKIVVCGGNTSRNIAIARLNSNGAVDTTFGTGGVASASLKNKSGGHANSAAGRILTDASGNLIVLGSAYTTSPLVTDIALARFLPGGQLDTTFASGGSAAIAASSSGEAGEDGLILPDGRIVLLAYGGNSLLGGTEVLRLLVGGKPSSISGTVFNDTNSNAAVDSSEKGIGGRTLFIDKNKNGKLDAGEQTAIGASNGTYTLKNLAAGSYRVVEQLPAGWRRTAPAAGYFDVTLAAGQNVVGKNFAETQNVLISGSVFNDANGDATRQSTEKGIAARTVFLDKNKNGKLDVGEASTITASDGTYTFKTMSAGSYRVAEVLPTGWRRTSPAAGYYDLTLTAGQTASGKVFADTTRAHITGIVFHDTNSNGKQDAGELGLAGWVVYIDANNNGKLDAGEISTTTDSKGNYSFVVLAGKYVLREVVKSGFTRTSPTAGSYSLTVVSGQSIAGENFGDR